MLMFLLWLGIASAHDANLTTFHVRQEPPVWWLEVMFPAVSSEMELQRQEPGRDLATVSDDAYKRRVIAHVKDTVHLSANGRPLTLGSGGIKLGGHQSTIKLMLEGMPADLTRLEAEVSTFSGNTGQHNLVRLIRGERRDRVILNHRNGFSGVVWQDRPPTRGPRAWVAASLLGPFFLGMSALAWSRRNRSSP